MLPFQAQSSSPFIVPWTLGLLPPQGGWGRGWGRGGENEGRGGDEEKEERRAYSPHQRPAWPHLQDPAPPLPRGLPGDVVQSLLGSWTRSPSKPRGAPAVRDTVPPHGLPGLVVQLWRMPRPGASGGTRCPRELRAGLQRRAPPSLSPPPRPPPAFLRLSPLEPLLCGLEGPASGASEGSGWEPVRALRNGPGEAGMEPPGGGRAAGRARAWGSWGGGRTVRGVGLGRRAPGAGSGAGKRVWAGP